MADDVRRPSNPIGWYVLVGIAAVLAIFWALSAVISFVVGVVKIAVVVILVLALVGYVVSRKANR